MTDAEADAAQQWDKVTPQVAWHLIERHADDWNEIDAMMRAWLRANVKEALLEEREDCAKACVALAILQDDAFRFGLTPTDGDLADKCASAIRERSNVKCGNLTTGCFPS